jgi:hypothetical protein
LPDEERNNHYLSENSTFFSSLGAPAPSFFGYAYVRGDVVLSVCTTCTFIDIGKQHSAPAAEGASTARASASIATRR